MGFARFFFYGAIGFVLAGCYKGHLYVQQEWVDAKFLASSHVGTPDPRQADPPEGQRLLISWVFPSAIFGKGLTFFITVRFWNQTEEILVKSINSRGGSRAFYFPNPCSEQDLKILTYKIEVFSEEGELIETWKHHFWRELIDFDRSCSSAQRSSSSVSSQERQGSVIETP